MCAFMRLRADAGAGQPVALIMTRMATALARKRPRRVLRAARKRERWTRNSRSRRPPAASASCLDDVFPSSCVSSAISKSKNKTRFISSSRSQAISLMQAPGFPGGPPPPGMLGGPPPPNGGPPVPQQLLPQVFPCCPSLWIPARRCCARVSRPASWQTRGGRDDRFSPALL